MASFFAESFFMALMRLGVALLPQTNVSNCLDMFSPISSAVMLVGLPIMANLIKIYLSMSPRLSSAGTFPLLPCKMG